MNIYMWNNTVLANIKQKLLEYNGKKTEMLCSEMLTHLSLTDKINENAEYKGAD